MVIKMTTLLATIITAIIIAIIIATMVVAGRKEVKNQNEKVENIRGLLWEIEVALKAEREGNPLPTWVVEAIWKDVVYCYDFDSYDLEALISCKKEKDYEGILIVCRQIMTGHLFC